MAPETESSAAPAAAAGGVLLLFACLAGGCVSPLRSPVNANAWVGTTAANEFDIGILGSRDRDVDGNARARYLGPLVERRASSEDAVFRAVRPLVSTVDAGPVERREWLWPVGERRSDGQESTWRLLTAYGTDFDATKDDSRYRGAVFPLLFWGRDADGHGYGAFFPLGGRLHEMLGRDRIFFLLFPLYARDVKDAVTSHNVVWPLISWGRGGDVARLRLFPLYGHSVNRGSWTKRFICWPFWTSVDYDYTPEAGGGAILFPFYGRVRTPEQLTQWFVPPFFKVAHGHGQRLLHCPWPVVQISHGDVDKCYVWPLWGRKRIENVRSGFVAWPLGRWEHIERGQTTVTRRYLLPVVYSETTRVNAGKSDVQNRSADGVVQRYVKLWPLFSYQQEADSARTRIPDLWPAKRSGPIERNWAPLWTLYRSQRKGDAKETDLLWGIYRSRRDPDGSTYRGVFPLYHHWTWRGQSPGREWSLLGGLLSGKRYGGERRVRFLYLMDFHWGREHNNVED